MEQELQRQMDNAMNFGGVDTTFAAGGPTAGQFYPPPPKSEISFNLSEADHNLHSVERDYQSQQTMAEKEIMAMGLNVPMMSQPQPLDENTRKIESKDSMWKPAPIIGREMTMKQENNYMQS